MANELEHLDTPGLTVYAKPLPIVASPWGDDAEAMSETGTTGYYSADVAGPAERYAVFVRAGEAPASTDAPAVATITVVPSANAVAAAVAAKVLTNPDTPLANDEQGRVTTSNPTPPAQGDGDVAVDHNYGGIDALRITKSGVGVDNARIRAYLASDYATGGRTVIASTYTGSDGRWVGPLSLDAGDYTLVISKPGVIESKTVTLTVS